MTELSDNIKKLAQEGKSYREIQSQLGCSKGTISYYLGVGQREKTRGRARDSRNKVIKFLQEYKQNHSCTDCGENYPYWIMEFDHLKDKLFSISHWNSKTISLDVIKQEIAKCELVCSNCHKNRTHYRSIKGGGDVLNVKNYYTDDILI